jgi:hypothetical protein
VRERTRGSEKEQENAREQERARESKDERERARKSERERERARESERERKRARESERDPQSLSLLHECKYTETSASTAGLCAQTPKRFMSVSIQRLLFRLLDCAHKHQNNNQSMLHEHVPQRCGPLNEM